MIRRSEQYNSDYMSRAMDERLEQLEERLTALYANAALETQSDFYDFMEKYKKDYKVMLDKLNAEKITKAEFDLWCSKKILKTTQYKEMLATLTNILVNTDVAAMAIIKGKLPFVVAQSYNFAQSLGFAAADKAGLSIGTFQVYNAWSVQKIIKDNPRLLPKVDIPLDKQWNKDKINTAITHSIIHGDSIPKVAKRLREVTNMDKNSAIRNARTSMTGAENLGRNESIKFMKKNGVPVQLMWSATHDSRTRDTHLLLDRTFQNEKGYFGEGILSKLIRFPGDPEGLPQEIYNCRCRASIYLEGIDHSKDAELYEKFMTENYPDDYRQLKEWEEKTGRAEERRQTLEYQKVLKKINKTGYHDPKELEKTLEKTSSELPKVSESLPTENLSSGEHVFVQGKDLSSTWERRKDQFAFEIEDVIDAQGFNGLPKIVDENEFNKAVKESNFIAQRTYSAPSKEVLNSYQDQLYNGKWYVDCSTGGSQYGKGMYCAADYTGTLSDGIKAEMSHYISLNRQRVEENAMQVAFGKMKRSDFNFKYKISDAQFNAYVKYLQTDAIIPSVYKLSAEEREVFYSLGTRQKEELRRSLIKKAHEMSRDAKAYSITETFTLMPNAKILKIHEQEDAINALGDEYAMNRLTDSKQKDLLKKYSSIQRQIDTERNMDRLDELYNERDKLIEDNKEDWSVVNKYRSEFFDKYAGKDSGVVATLMGYDAINAEGHGESGSYTVILNRTKLIIKKGGTASD